MSERLGDLVSDVKVFVGECCELGPDHEVLIEKLFVKWTEWSAARGIRYTWASQQFSEKLRAVVPTIRSGRIREGKQRPTLLTGIGLRKRK